MVAACGFTVLLEHPGSPARVALPDPILRRALMGIAMGATAVGLIASTWGKRSGAHINPATTLTFFRLGRVAGPDAAFYARRSSGARSAASLLAAAALRGAAGDERVMYAATLPGSEGIGGRIRRRGGDLLPPDDGRARVPRTRRDGTASRLSRRGRASRSSSRSRRPFRG
jgi:aquaporin Z